MGSNWGLMIEGFSFPTGHEIWLPPSFPRERYGSVVDLKQLSKLHRRCPRQSPTA